MHDDWFGLLIALSVGALGGVLGWFVLQPVFAAPVLARMNFRDRAVPVGGGLVLVLAVIGAAAAAVISQVGWGMDAIVGGDAAVLVAVAGFALLGFVDDVVGSGRQRGFKGHLGEMARGRLSAGGLKLVGGAGVALVAAYLTGPRSLGGLIRDAALIALAANLMNLFDLAPGRAIKAGTIAFVALVVVSGGNGLLRATAVTAGAALGLLWPDLREKVMLGDTGANPLGAALGLGVVLVCAASTRTLVVVALLLLNLASEFVSFSRVIAAVPPLRVLDGVGRMR